MRELHYPQVFERMYEQVLDNGLMVRVIPKPGFSRKYAFLAVDYGSMDTHYSLGGTSFRSPDGVAHYLEHKMFDMPRGNVMQEFAARGANPNAFTSYSMTAYYFDCTDDFDDNLRLLLDYVSTPYYTQESVEKERGIIAQEIKMYEDSPSSQVYEQLFAAMYRHHPVRVPIAGTVESIAEISARTLEECYHAFYTPGNMCLCVVGDVDPELVLHRAEEILPRQSRPAALRDYGPAETLGGGPRRVSREMEVSMPMFMLGFQCPPASGPAEVMRGEMLGDLAAELLMGEASPLYAALYERGLIDAGFSVGYEGMRGVSLLVASGDSRDPEAVSAAILDECARLTREGADEALFQRLKRSALGRRLRDLDSFESICFRQCSYYFDRAEYFTFPSVYETISLEDTLAFLRDNVTERRSGLSVIAAPEGE